MSAEARLRAKADATKQSTFPLAAPWIASRSLSSGAHSRDPVARNDGSGVMMDRKESASGEDSLIARYFRPLATDPGAFDLGDDAAVLKALGDDIVVTTDAVVEGVHFLSDDPPETIARKALRVNLSDLAARCARGLQETSALKTEGVGNAGRPMHPQPRVRYW